MCVFEYLSIYMYIGISCIVSQKIEWICRQAKLIVSAANCLWGTIWAAKVIFVSPNVGICLVSVYIKVIYSRLPLQPMEINRNIQSTVHLIYLMFQYVSKVIRLILHSAFFQYSHLFFVQSWWDDSYLALNLYIYIWD